MSILIIHPSSMIHPTIFIYPFVHASSHPAIIHSPFTHLPMPSFHSTIYSLLINLYQFIIHPSFIDLFINLCFHWLFIQLANTLQVLCLLGHPFHQPQSCPLPCLPVCLTLSLIPSWCLPPPSPDSVAALQSSLPPPSGHLRPSPSRPGPPHTRLGQTHQHPG